MANANTTASKNNLPAESFSAFTAGHQIYQPNPNAGTDDLADHLSTRLAHLSSMLRLISGDGLERFSNMSDKIQADYIWSCSMIADECEELADRIAIASRR